VLSLHAVRCGLVSKTRSRKGAGHGAEKAVATVCSGLLGVEQISRHNNFFELGAHSPVAVKAVLELEKSTGSCIELRHILLEDVSQIALHVDKTLVGIKQRTAIGQADSSESCWAGREFHN